MGTKKRYEKLGRGEWGGVREKGSVRDSFCLGVGWLVGWSVGRSVVWLVGWLVGWLACWLAGWLVSWLVGWLACWLVGRLGWLAGWPAILALFGGWGCCCCRENGVWGCALVLAWYRFGLG